MADMELQSIKQRFGIIGNNPLLNRAIDIARQVAPTDLSVLITGESGTGKEVFPQIIHSYSSRKHGTYIAVNCGAIPEGTIDSELFGHEKGAFTGATDSRKGYFEVADGGTIFLDEVGELPLSTQVRLLRVLETGEFIRVGSSKVQKTNVRVVAATNVNLVDAITENKFREDLYYRLNTVPITIPPLRDRKEDIPLLFRKFAVDFAEKYRMPPIVLDDEARKVLISYYWPGNVRQLKNVTEQISIIEQKRDIDAETLKRYLPDYSSSQLPTLFNKRGVVDEQTFATEREILYKILYDMRSDMNELKKLVFDLMRSGKVSAEQISSSPIFQDMNSSVNEPIISPTIARPSESKAFVKDLSDIQDTEEIQEETLSLEEKEKELIIKALEKHNGRRKLAAQDLGISERTLYRKIKEYKINL
ncbi:sigma-54 interaction domain-containing protein [Tenuifilum thalassicum]|uniref:Sigma-54-dependent Fis family transcriptional regulator n=1 Tax=Tenuifilum thalassicum TaxID=2590900 RepID=A0A7D4CHY1_9BACT|nr:sigma-54 dependent transcriptional regulator [Tenuifilum thalassicum]QKG80906.1 sigma-54-dependent Fis family transcriptional regulator [Tenuifilum thalassicum]